MRSFKYLVILVLLFIGINNIKAFDTSLKVYDYAQELTESEELNLKESIDKYINEHNMDMAVVIVKHHDKPNTMVYADDFYDYNGFGIGANYDGVIFVIDFTFGYTDIWMSTTGKAISIYTDARIDRILDAVAEQKNNGYYEMLEAFIDKTNYYASQGIPTYDEYYSESSINWTFVIIISLVVPSIIILILVLKNKMVKLATNATQYLVDGSVVISKRSDQFITTHTTSYRINTSSSSSGGSSIHRSSSGRSHGGGGRRL